MAWRLEVHFDMGGEAGRVPGSQLSAGDIVVTKVSRHYHVSRVQAEGQPFLSIDVVNELSEALTLACRLITTPQRVFLYNDAGSRFGIEIDCATRAWEHLPRSRTG